MPPRGFVALQVEGEVVAQEADQQIVGWQAEELTCSIENRHGQKRREAEAGDRSVREKSQLVLQKVLWSGRSFSFTLE